MKMTLFTEIKSITQLKDPETDITIVTKIEIDGIPVPYSLAKIMLIGLNIAAEGYPEVIEQAITEGLLEKQ